jgi:kinesin family protein 3/17
MDIKHGEIKLRKPDSNEQAKEFTFDSVYDISSRQEDIYVNSVFPVVENVLIGYNGTIFAYGQTGTGKTFTIEGVDDPPELLGVMPRAFETIFSNIQCDNPEQRQYLVRASYMELYKEDIRDLLSANPKAKLELHEKPDTGVYVKDLTTTVVTSVQELKKIQLIGRKQRTTAETKMNDRSSRSHAIFTITIETSEQGIDGKPRIRAGKFHLVDLAGSERQSKTEAVGERLEEATKINLSLSTLCHVISSLVDSKSSFTPYRNSKLTRILQDSLGGNTKTVMIANIGPADYNYDETLNTLRYANRAKSIKNKPRINEDPKDAMIREFQAEIERLKAELAQIDMDPNATPETLKRQQELIKRMGGVVPSQERLRELAKENEEKQREVEQRRVLARQATQEVTSEHQKLKENMKKQEEEKLKSVQRKEDLDKKLRVMEKQIGIRREYFEQEQEKKRLEKLKVQSALEEEKVKERRLKQNLEAKESEIGELKKKFVTQKEELQAKTSMLQGLWRKLQSFKTKMRETEELFWSEREDTMNQILNYSRELKLLDLIIENFIPEREKKRIEKCAHWDKENETYKLVPQKLKTNLNKAKRPVSAIGLKRPVSEYSRMVGTPSQNPRFKYENILPLDLDMPERTTENYPQAQESGRVKNAFYNILVESQDDFEYNAVYLL